MATRAPSRGQILVALGFALSCFGLVLFLWVAFGGPIPLTPKSYSFEVPFPQAGQLAQEADVRISGVSVGKVKDIVLTDNDKAEATIELNDRYAPIPSDTRAILRQKTLLGETYVELSPGTDTAPPLPEGGDACGRERRAVGPARRDLPDVQPEDPRRVPGLDAAAGARVQRARGRISRR